MTRSGAIVRSAAAGLLACWLAACGADGDSASGASPASPAADARRSVVLVTIDTLRADALGAYGSPYSASPNLDRLAAEGVLFEQAHASSPSTLPSHSTLLTGKRPFRHGVRSNTGDLLRPEEVTVAERLAEAGYATAAEVASVVIAGHTGIAQGFQSFRDTDSTDVELAKIDLEMPRELAISHSTRNAEDITARGIEFLASHADEPFFLWLHYYDPHWPQTPPEPYATRFALQVAGARPGQVDGEQRFIREHLYAAEVAYVDAQLGRLRAAMETLGLDQHTLLVVTSDHGEALGDHGEDTHTYFVYQSTMHVPLLLWGPDLPGNLRVRQPVRAEDVAPTLLDWLGEPGLADADGSSLLPLVQDPEAGSERVVYGESVELRRVFAVPVLRFLREGRWKYIHKPRPALYDLDADPDEHSDVAAEHPDHVARLYARLATLLEGATPSGASAAPDLDPETAAQLEALGYAVGDPSVDLGDELDSLRVEGVDPDDMVQDVRLISRPWPEGGDSQVELQSMRDLAARYPQSSPVLAKLLDFQLTYGLGPEALETLRRGVELAPDNERYWSNLGELLVKMGRLEEAREVLPEVLERFPCDYTGRTHLAAQLAREGDHAARIALLEAGVEADCDEPSPELANELAYALATAPEASLRDADRAVELARSAVEGLPENPLVLDTLAVAQAEQGDRAAAGATLEHALALARDQKLPEAVHELLRDHARTIAAGEPIRE